MPPDLEMMDAQPSSSGFTVHIEPSDSFISQMKQAIKKIKENVPKLPARKITATLKKEFQLKPPESTESQELLYKALNTIKPTSVESKRVFSLSGGIITKIRNRLSDKAVNVLIFLEAYFIKIGK